MIYINEVIANHIKNNDFVIVYKSDVRHLTGNKENIIIIRKGKHIKYGKCTVKLIIENISAYKKDIEMLLNPYLKDSGYNTIDEWFNYIEEICNSEKCRSGFLYRIDKVYLYD